MCSSDFHYGTATEDAGGSIRGSFIRSVSSGLSSTELSNQEIFHRERLEEGDQEGIDPLMELVVLEDDGDGEPPLQVLPLVGDTAESAILISSSLETEDTPSQETAAIAGMDVAAYLG